MFYLMNLTFINSNLFCLPSKHCNKELKKLKNAYNLFLKQNYHLLLINFGEFFALFYVNFFY